MPRSLTSLNLIFAHPRWTPDEARTVLGALDASGLTVAEFAARYSVQVQRLFAWRRKFTAEPAALARPDAPTFVEVAPRTDLARMTPARFELVLPDGASLRVEGQIDANAVRALLALLRETRAC